MASESIAERLSNLTPAQRELLAKKMNQQQKQLPSNILVIKEGDSQKRRPIFCMHPPLGVTGYYINIASHLPEDQPVYGIQCPSLTSDVVAHSDMTEMAKHYFSLVQEVQSEPPYQFLGHSSGAFIAYEMSKLVDSPSENIPFLFCVDQHAPVGQQEPVAAAYAGDNLDDNIQAIYLTCWLVGMAHNTPLTFSVEQLAVCESREARFDLVAGFFKEAGFLPQAAESSSVSKVLRMIANHFNADSSFIEKHNSGEPQDKYDGKLILFRSTEKTNWIGLGIETEADTSPASGWEPFCSNDVEVINIPESDHINLFMEPAVKTMADELTKYLYRSE